MPWVERPTGLTSLGAERVASGIQRMFELGAG